MVDKKTLEALGKGGGGSHSFIVLLTAEEGKPVFPSVALGGRGEVRCVTLQKETAPGKQPLI